MSESAAPETGNATPVVTTGDLSTGQPETGDTTDWKAEAEKWQALSRKNEERAKSNGDAAKELEKLRQASMSDQEKAVAVAVEAAKAETMRTVGARLVDAEVKAAAAGRTVDVEALLEGLDRSRFLDDSGEPNTKAITAWVDRIAPVTEPSKPGFPDLGQGQRGNGNGALALNDPLLKDLVAKVGQPRG